MRIIYCVTLCCLLFAVCSQLQAFESNIDIVGGYRKDMLTCRVNSYGADDVFLLSDNLEIKDIRIKQIGFQGKIFSCSNCYVQGSAFMGKVDSGHYFETVTDNLGASASTSASVKGGGTRDYCVSAGCVYPFSNCIWFSPVSGWSFHSQHVQIDNAVSGNTPEPLLNDLRYNNRWQGAWTGFDAFVSVLGWDIYAGYTYHWLRWNAEWLLDGPDVPGVVFSDERKAKKGVGQQANVELKYCVCSFELGFQFAYRFFKANHGRVKPKAGSNTAVGMPHSEVDKIPQATWQSYCYQATVGMRF